MMKDFLFLYILLCYFEKSPAAVQGEPTSGFQDGCAGREENKQEDSGVSSFLWTLRRDPPSYFFGTIHVPYALVWESIQDNVKQAFQRSDSVYFELDILDGATQRALSYCKLLPGRARLSDVVPADLYHRLDQHLNRVEQMMPKWLNRSNARRTAHELFAHITSHWRRMRPIWVVVMLNALTESEIQALGTPLLDTYLAIEAKRLKKKHGAVEDVKDQCEPLNQLNHSQVIFTLNYTLNYLEQLEESERLGQEINQLTTKQLIQHYKCVQLDEILVTKSSQVSSLFLHSNVTLNTDEQDLVEEINSYFRQQLIQERNERMAQTVATLLRENNNTSFFFAFGAGHFLGSQTVLGALVEEGFVIENNAPDQPVYFGNNYEGGHHTTLLADIPQGDPELRSFMFGRWRKSRRRRPDRRSDRRRNRARLKDDRMYQTTTPRFNNLWQPIYRQRPRNQRWYSESDYKNRQWKQSAQTSTTSSAVPCFTPHQSSHLQAFLLLLIWKLLYKM